MPRSPASVPDLCISSRSSSPKAGGVEDGNQFGFFLVIQAWPIDDQRLRTRESFSPYPFRASPAFWKKGGIVMAVSPWYFVA